MKSANLRTTLKKIITDFHDALHESGVNNTENVKLRVRVWSSTLVTSDTEGKDTVEQLLDYDLKFELSGFETRAT